MQFNCHTTYKIIDKSDISFIKREVHKIVKNISFTEEQLGKIDLIITEIATNLVKHKAVNGEILVKLIEGEEGIEIISADNGPGMHDPARMLKDGVSTYGSRGEGLGAIKRLSHNFDLFSLNGVGTIVLSRFYLQHMAKELLSAERKLNIKCVMVPYPGETLCGDGASISQHKGVYTILALDGLGHGKEANLASQKAIDSAYDTAEKLPGEMLKLLHEDLKNTRGAVAAIASINTIKNTINYCGIGNISGKTVVKDSSKSLISYNGTLGHNIPRTFHDHTYSWDDYSYLIMHSDGLKSRWEMSHYPNLLSHDAGLIAAFLYKTNVRGRDDSMIMVIKGKIHSYEK